MHRPGCKRSFRRQLLRPLTLRLPPQRKSLFHSVATSGMHPDAGVSRSVACEVRAGRERELINIFRSTADGRLVQEWMQTDTYDFLRQLGAVE
jgi:hypothetical protein